MNEPALSTAPADLFHWRAAIQLGVILLTGLTLVLLFAALEKPRRAQLETYEEVTAVGDSAFFRAAAQVGRPAITFRGQPLYPLSPEPAKMRLPHPRRR